MGEIENRRKDGRVYAEQMSITPVRDRDGAVAHFVAVKRDVSEQRTLEAQFRQAQKMEAIGQLAGGIAHDFNNLMTAILGYCEILIDQIPAEDPNRADVQEIRSAGVRASSLTRQLLAFSRKQILQPTTFDVRGTVAGLDKMLRRVIREDISLLDGAGRPPAVRPRRRGAGRAGADQPGDQRVGRHAQRRDADRVDADGRCSATTSCGRTRARPKGRFVGFEVHDTGTGMPPEVLGRIFEPFFTTKPQGKGTGLGLSMVYGIVKQSGGYIAADSALGEGSVFTVYLPEEAEPEAGGGAVAAAAAWNARRRRRRSSWPKTTRPFANWCAGCSTRSGFNVVAGGSAREALESLESLGRQPGPAADRRHHAGHQRRRVRAHPARAAPVAAGDLHVGLSRSERACRRPTAPRPDRLLQKPVSPEALLQAVHESLGTNGAGLAGMPA